MQEGWETYTEECSIQVRKGQYQKLGNMCTANSKYNLYMRSLSIWEVEVAQPFPNFTSGELREACRACEVQSLPLARAFSTIHDVQAGPLKTTLSHHPGRIRSARKEFDPVQLLRVLTKPSSAINEFLAMSLYRRLLYSCSPGLLPGAQQGLRGPCHGSPSRPPTKRSGQKPGRRQLHGQDLFTTIPS